MIQKCKENLQIRCGESLKHILEGMNFSDDEFWNKHLWLELSIYGKRNMYVAALKWFGCFNRIYTKQHDIFTTKLPFAKNEPQHFRLIYSCLLKAHSNFCSILSVYTV